MTLTAIAIGIYLGCLYYMWRLEQPAIAWVRQNGGTVWIGQSHLPVVRSLVGTKHIVLSEKQVQTVYNGGLFLGHLGWISERATGVLMTRSPIADADLMVLQSLTEMQTLDLAIVSLTSEGLTPLQKLEHLRELTLTGPAIDDSCLQVLAPIRSLRSICMYRTNVTSAGIRHIRQVRPEVQVVACD